MSFGTKWIAFYGAKLRCFLPRLHSSTKAMWYANETLLFQDSERYGLRNNRTFSIKISTLTIQAFRLSGFCVYSVLQKGNMIIFLFE